MQPRTIAIVVLVVSGTAAPAAADWQQHRDRVEVTWGFLGGKRSYAHQSFAYDEGDASPALAAPFVGEPFDGVRVLGIGFDARVVFNSVRGSFGMDWPYPSIEPDIMLATAGTVPARVRSLDTREMRIAIGYELRLIYNLTLYADLVGTAYEANAKLVIGEAQSTYKTEGFGFSIRSGLLFPIAKHYFLYSHVDVGVTEHIPWAAHLGLGFTVGD